MSAITTHVLDTSRGRPAQGVKLVLASRSVKGDWAELAAGETDADGRNRSLLAAGARPAPGVYRLRFELEEYFRKQGVPAFYPFADIVFEVRDPSEHYHVPLLLSPFGYSTYRGS